MVDPGTRAKMQGNRRTDTKPEMELRAELHARGLRFRKDHRVQLDMGRSDPRPDIAFTRAKVAVFVDGCFWHLCPEHGRVPETNAPFWRAKFKRNQQRDAANDQLLAAAGWEVVRIWEHVDVSEAADQVEAAYYEAAKAWTDSQG